MAIKCRKCDYPYVPFDGTCANCGADNKRYDDGNNSPLFIFLGLVIGLFLTIYLYLFFTLDGSDFYGKEFVLGKNHTIAFSAGSYFIWNTNSGDCNCEGGAYKIEDNKIILDSNERRCPERRNKKTVYSWDNISFSNLTIDDTR